jgi:signal transduction histidine kinase
MFTMPLTHVFKRKRYNKFFLTNGFYLFSVSIIFFEIIFSVIIYYYVQHSYLTRLKTQLVTETYRIENTLKDLFSETQQVMTYVGKQISLYGKSDPRFIEKILLNSSKITSRKTIYSWSLFDWINPESQIIVNSQIGIVNHSPEKIHDPYIWKCQKLPWTLQFSHPTIGDTSGMWIIPAGIGVTNNKNEYLGTLNVGFNVAELNNKIQQLLAFRESSFIILDDDLKVILQSADNTIDPKSSYYTDMLVNKNYFSEEKGYLKSSVSYKNIEYVYYKKMDEYPYFILAGFDKIIVQRMLWDLILPRLFELYGVGFFCLGLLYFLRRKMFNLVEASGSAKKTFSQRINQETKNSISSILTYSNILLKYFTGETKIIVTKERQIEFIEKIYKEALDLYTMTSNTLSMTYIDIKPLIENSIDLQIETAFKKNIKIRTHFDSALLPFYGDEFRLKQIVTSLISLAMEYSPRGSIIKISATMEAPNENQMFLVVEIADNGFNLTAEDIRRISEEFSSDEEHEDFMASHLEFSSIEKLITLHEGTCHVYTNEQKGKTVKVSLPYQTEKESKIDFTKDKANVYWLSEPSESAS